MMNEKYNYWRGVAKSIEDYLEEELDLSEYEDANTVIEFLKDSDDFREQITMYSYCDEESAQEYAVPNMYQFFEACYEFGYEINFINEEFSWGFVDSVIRDYLIWDVLDDMKDKIEEMIRDANNAKNGTEE